jgi:hypothetical protein
MLPQRSTRILTALAIGCGILGAVALVLAMNYISRVSQNLALSAPKTITEAVESEHQVNSVPLSDPFFVQAQGVGGSLKVYEMASQTIRFELPPGLLTTEGQTYYAAVSQADKTLLQTFSPRRGEVVAEIAVPGQWALTGVAPTGRWVTLTRLPTAAEKNMWVRENRWETDIQVIDMEQGQVKQTLHLEGNFEVETILANGDALFLIQHFPALNPTQYLIRLYDLAAQQLQPEALRAKNATETLMTGLAWGVVASTDGQWLLTLYLNTSRNTAFIHALNLENKFPLCIDLPSGSGDFNDLRHYALALSPNGNTAYAANVALGVVAEISLTDFQVKRVVEFLATGSGQVDNDKPTNYSVVSQDGRSLYFSSGWDVWRYDTQLRQVDGPYAKGTIQGLALSQDEQTLYVALAGHLPQKIDLQSKSALSFKSEPAK